MEQILDVAVIGTGNLSTKRIYPYLGQSGMRVCGIAARHKEHAREMCALYGGSPYTDWKALIESETPDAVIACVGPELHNEVSRYCMERRIPVYTEKPPASNAGQIQELLELSEKYQTLCMTGFKKRYSRCYLRARDWLHQYDSSDWQCFSLDWYAGKFDLENRPRETVLLDFAIHALDLVTWLFGPAAAVSVMARGWDSFAVSMQMASGMVGSLTISDHRSFDFPGEEMEITVAGGHGMSIHNSSSWRILKDGKPDEWYEPPTCLAGGDSGYNTGMLKELEVFAEQVRRGIFSVENLKVSLSSMKLYDAVLHSIENEGQQVLIGRNGDGGNY